MKIHRVQWKPDSNTSFFMKNSSKNDKIFNQQASKQASKQATSKQATPACLSWFFDNFWQFLTIFSISWQKIIENLENQQNSWKSDKKSLKFLKSHQNSSNSLKTWLVSRITIEAASHASFFMKKSSKKWQNLQSTSKQASNKQATSNKRMLIVIFDSFWQFLTNLDNFEHFLTKNHWNSWKSTKFLKIWQKNHWNS